MDSRTTRDAARQEHASRLRQALLRHRETPFPRKNRESEPLSEQLGDAVGRLAEYDACVFGCAQQLVYSDHPDIALCRRILAIDERLSEQIRSSPDDEAKSHRKEVLAYKLQVDELVELAWAVLTDREMDQG